MSDAKMVIVIRKDLKMRRGKEISQGAHSALSWLVERAIHGMSGKIKFSTEEQNWFVTGMTKICLQVNSEQELLDVYQKALQKGLTAHLITDAGRTEFGGVATKTCVGIGPGKSDLIDLVTGTLKLY